MYPRVWKASNFWSMGVLIARITILPRSQKPTELPGLVLRMHAKDSGMKRLQVLMILINPISPHRFTQPLIFGVTSSRLAEVACFNPWIRHCFPGVKKSGIFQDKIWSFPLLFIPLTRIQSVVTRTSIGSRHTDIQTYKARVFRDRVTQTTLKRRGNCQATSML